MIRPGRRAHALQGITCTSTRGHIMIMHDHDHDADGRPFVTPEVTLVRVYTFEFTSACARRGRRVGRARLFAIVHQRYAYLARVYT